MSFFRYTASSLYPECDYGEITEDVIHGFEEKYKVKLPVALLTLLKENNGGGFDDDNLLLKEEVIEYVNSLTLDLSGSKWTMAILPLSEFYAKRQEFEDDDEARLEVEECWGDISRLIAFSGDGHEFYVMDYRGSKKCKGILYACYEGVPDELRKVADTFEELFDFSSVGKEECEKDNTDPSLLYGRWVLDGEATKKLLISKGFASEVKETLTDLKNLVYEFKPNLLTIVDDRGETKTDYLGCELSGQKIDITVRYHACEPDETETWNFKYKDDRLIMGEWVFKNIGSK